jgi:hypothetical protein
MDDNISIEALFDILDLGDLEVLEGECGITLDELGAPGSLRATVVTHMIYLARRHTDPSFTLDDARRIKLTAIGEQLPPSDAGTG